MVPDCAETFLPLQLAITEHSPLHRYIVTVEEQHLFQLPTSLSGFGIHNLIETAVQAYKTSKQGTAIVSEAIKGVIDFKHEQHLELLTIARKRGGKAKEDDYVLKFEGIIPTLSPDRQRALQRTLKGKTSTWSMYFLYRTTILTCHPCSSEMV